MRLLLLGLLVGLLGCAPTWQKAGASPQDVEHDNYECAQETRDPAPSVVVNRGVGDTSGFAAMGRGISVRSLYKACMRARGYVEE